MAAFKYLINLQNGKGYVDDIDHSVIAACVEWVNWLRRSLSGWLTALRALHPGKDVTD